MRTCAICRTFSHSRDALVVNDTRVIPARLEGVRVRGEAIASIEATLIERVDDCRWRALARPAKRLKVGERIRFGEASESMACLLAALDAEVEEKGEAGEVLLRFEFTGAALDEAIERLGAPPLPPYIASRRALSPSDQADYQTMFAAKPWRGRGADGGARILLRRWLLASRRVASRCIKVTLHVGAGTFAPVRVEDTRDHKMHSEWGSISAATADALNAVREAGGRIVCVGTTSARVLESAADENGRLRPFSGRTDIFITPGYRVSLRRCAHDQLSFAAIDFVHACRGLQRARDDAGGLRARRSSRLSVLFVRRRLPPERARKQPQQRSP